MSKDREFTVRLKNAERVRSGAKSYIKPSADELASIIRAKLIEEIPQSSGALAESVVVNVGQATTYTYKIQVTIGNENVPYALAVWKGLDPTIYSVSPINQPAMIFDISKWPQYDGRFGNVNIFKFSRTLNNYIPENDFIGRAIFNVEELAKNIFRKNIKIVFAPGK